MITVERHNDWLIQKYEHSNSAGISNRSSFKFSKRSRKTATNACDDVFRSCSSSDSFTVHSRLLSGSEFAIPRLTSSFQIGSSSPSFAQQIADIQRLMGESGLKFVMHATGTTIEGPWDQVVQLIGLAHTLTHQQGIVRVQTDIRIQTRTDKVQPIEGTVASVERILSVS
ncbi:cell wall biogenesis protein [Penicillium canariense]|uniref:Cell wall biogenesis protein n=1 Tax=Penicillium canariense TaxID=189055 RepID=A0A9W9IC92_9EURO|nr:cell wall biogenesis protein [Penicillium canariense]KAJ5168752.1 cell wall biogenesis protein [Penicillium canariense]